MTEPPPRAPLPAPPHWPRRLATVALLVLLLGGGAIAGLFLYARHVFTAAGPLPEAATFVVPHGGAAQVAGALGERGIVAQPEAFRLAAFLTRGDGPLRAGEFAFPAHASLRDVLDLLRTAKPVQHLLTVAEGLTARQIGALIDKVDTLSGTAEPPREGSVLPQTYAYELGTPREAILARARAAMQRALQEAWAGRVGETPLASAQDALILASVVERETARPEERPHVAAVFLNRLRLGMKLQSDPTVIYGATGGAGSLDRPISRADLDGDNPYNTYRVRGLPPGPICSPGLASIRAVTQPAASADLYFVADGSGGHAFSRSLDEHTRNVARWHALSAASPPAPPAPAPPAAAPPSPAPPSAAPPPSVASPR